MLANIQDFLQLMLEAGASDLHITQESPPLIRVHGELRPLAYPPLTPYETMQCNGKLHNVHDILSLFCDFDFCLTFIPNE